jgi:replicative DNA helicase
MNTWELAAIGTVLSDPEAMDVAEDLLPQDFTRSNRLVWAEISALHRRGALDYRGVVESLRSKQLLDEVGSDITDISGAEYLEYTKSYAGIQMGEYVRQVVDSAVKRNLKEAASLIALDANTERDADEILDEAERRIMSLRRTRNSGGVPISEILDAFIPHMQELRDGDITPSIAPQLQGVSDIIGYYEDSDYIIVAGRPGEGKSSYLRFEAQRLAERGKSVLVFNLENNEVEYARFSIALRTGIDAKKLKLPRLLSRAELERVKRAAEELRSLPMEVVTLGSPTVSEVTRIARAKSRTFHQDVIMLDYVQLINNGLNNRVQDVTLSSQTLRALAMKDQLNIPVMCAAQLSRAIESRGPNSAPQLSDLRESGSLEQDATVVMFIRQVWTSTPSRAQMTRFPENVDERGLLLPTLRAVPARFLILKNRNGPVGVTPEIKWSKHTGNFQTLVRNDHD